MWVMMVIGGGCFSRKMVKPQWGERGDLELERDGWSHDVLGVFRGAQRERGSLTMNKGERWVAVRGERERGGKKKRKEKKWAMDINFE